jgi:hypothetical protein
VTVGDFIFSFSFSAVKLAKLAAVKKNSLWYLVGSVNNLDISGGRSSLIG